MGLDGEDAAGSPERARRKPELTDRSESEDGDGFIIDVFLQEAVYGHAHRREDGAKVRIRSLGKLPAARRGNLGILRKDSVGMDSDYGHSLTDMLRTRAALEALSARDMRLDRDEVADRVAAHPAPA